MWRTFLGLVSLAFYRTPVVSEIQSSLFVFIHAYSGFQTSGLLSTLPGVLARLLVPPTGTDRG